MEPSAGRDQNGTIIELLQKSTGRENFGLISETETNNDASETNEAPETNNDVSEAGGASETNNDASGADEDASGADKDASEATTMRLRQQRCV